MGGPLQSQSPVFTGAAVRRAHAQLPLALLTTALPGVGLSAAQGEARKACAAALPGGQRPAPSSAGSGDGCGAPCGAAGT